MNRARPVTIASPLAHGRLVSLAGFALLAFVLASTGCKKNDPPPVPSDVAAPPDDATRTATGLAYKILERGSGTNHPTSTSKVTVHYTGWTTDGEMFDSSVVRGKPATFPLNGVIAGWTEGVQLMVVGDKARFWIPQELAYRGRDPKGMLVFDVELLSFE